MTWPFRLRRPPKRRRPLRRPAPRPGRRALAIALAEVELETPVAAQLIEALLARRQYRRETVGQREHWERWVLHGLVEARAL